MAPGELRPSGLAVNNGFLVVHPFDVNCVLGYQHMMFLTFDIVSFGAFIYIQFHS